jgi:membrane protein YqaA with SNARE-associated domain
MPDPHALVDLGLAGLFLAAFLGGSVLVFPSELVLIAVLAAGASTGSAVAAATAGNVLGAVTVYGIGWALARGLLATRFRDRWSEETLTEGRERIERWGAWSLLLAWVPIFGDTLVLGAGVAGIRPLVALALVTAGKGARYVFVAWAVV